MTYAVIRCAGKPGRRSVSAVRCREAHGGIGALVSALAWIAVGVFVTAYALIATEKVNRVAVALGGASII